MKGRFEVKKATRGVWVGIAILLTICAACGGGGGKGGDAPPPAPEGVVAVDGNGQVGIAWNAVVGATSYNLYWAAHPGVTKNSGTKIAGADSPYAHQGLTNNQRYYYVVTAVNAKGESAESREVTGLPHAETPPAAPSRITASTGETQVLLGWDEVSEAEAASGISYNIYWSVQAGVRKSTGAKIAGATNPYTHTGLQTGQTYYYVVTAQNAYGESLESREVSATPQPGIVPAPPTEFTASVDRDRVALQWKASPGATHYNLYWSTRPDVTVLNGNRIANVSSPYAHEGLEKNATYYYLVTAVNATGESNPSPRISATVTDWLEDIVVAMGDSITAGYGVSPSECYVNRLSGLLGKTVRNEGVSGERSDGGANRIGWLLEHHRPKVVTVYYGNNDAGLYPIDWTIGHLYTILRACQENGTTPVLAAIGPQFDQWAWRRPYIVDLNKRIRQLASDMGVRVADIEAAMDWNRGYISEDGLHPNSNGHNVIANTFAHAIR